MLVVRIGLLWLGLLLVGSLLSRFGLIGARGVGPLGLAGRLGWSLVFRLVRFASACLRFLPRLVLPLLIRRCRS